MPHPQVLIVGAGPTGLVLAAQLNRLGVDIRIIDKHAAPLELTKSAALHARTLEHLRDLGVADGILAEGQRVDVLTLRTSHRDRLSVDFRVLDDTAYPHIVDIPQYRTEQILIDHLTRHGVALHRSTTLAGLTPTDSGVTATLTTPDGGTETVTARWIVGCDGAHSRVRDLLGIDFDGSTYSDPWVLCDAVVDWPLPRNEMTFSSDGSGIYGVFPLPGRRRFRLAYTQTIDATGRPVPPTLDDAQAALSRTGIPATIESTDQFWTFNLSRRQATTYRKGRLFLAGDAGHVHTPFGGQGLNLGMADAINLGWKLAAVIAGRAPTALLDSYQAERHRIGRQVVTFTHLGAEAMLLRGDPRRHLRDIVLTGLQASAPARRLLAHRLSQLGHSYRGTAGVTGRMGGLHGGDRLPDPTLFDGITHRPQRLHDLLATDPHTLLLTAPKPDATLTTRINGLADALARRWPGAVELRLLTPAWQVAQTARAQVPVLLDRGRNAQKLYDAGAAAFVIRPDRHIGYAGSPEPSRIEQYLSTVLTKA
ncbi:FAD-dependent monooxygenase [Salinispora tropica]|uniref:Monooxygenase, FAD-binding n=1 Tax=Salinispora tropica (strain ATCC BAA-916 / DSM 44818 / JCM 13857 / NBRC 105044 / CNB-440) TaxID=369723 RepID=A4X442_SALTO|nr:FAD-dependent monooxygenase [Salinispora tropica]ABP53642.1 monooxygenase, FAD-binding [Salinispora tropica CNB-440]